MFRRNFLLILLGWLLTIVEKKAVRPQPKSFLAHVAKEQRETKPIMFYIDPDGNDSWSGKQAIADGEDGPFASWSKVQAAIREMRSPSATRLLEANRPIKVIFGEGTYWLKEPIIFTPEDSGTESSPITYQAEPGSKVLFSGGQKITGWQETQLNQQRLWVVDLPLELKGINFQQLWVNNQRRGRSRYPSQGYLKVKSVNNRQGKPWTDGDRSFQYHEGDLPPNINPVGSEAVVLSRWLDYRLPVRKIERQQQTLQFDQESVFQILANDLYYLENAWDFFDTPGEWYLDRQLDRLFYLPLAEESIIDTEVVAPVLSSLIKFEGTPESDATLRRRKAQTPVPSTGHRPATDWLGNAHQESDRFVEHLEFNHLSFAHTDWHLPPGISGYNQNSWGVSGAIMANGIRNCRWRFCTFKHLGNYGIELFRGCQHNQITSCSFFDLGAGAIKVGERQTYVPQISPAEVSHHNTLTYNHVYDGGKFFPSAVGIRVVQSHHNLIAHNHVHDLYYTAISARGTWGFSETQAYANVIEHNYVHHIGRLSNGEGPILSDMGGIYTLGAQRDTVIRHNKIHDVHGLRYGGWGIYLDEGSSYLVVDRNLVYRTSHNGFFQHYGKDNLICRNIFAFGGKFQLRRDRQDLKYARAGNFTSFRFINNIVYWQQGRFTLNSAADLRSQAVFEDNIYWKVGQPDFLIAYVSWQEWQKGDRHSQVVDPLFVAPQKGNFALQPNSPAWKLGIGSFITDN